MPPGLVLRPSQERFPRREFPQRANTPPSPSNNFRTAPPSNARYPDRDDLGGTISSCLYSPVLRTAIHTQRDIAPLHSFFDSENILTTGLESTFLSLQAQPGGSQYSNLNPQPYDSPPVHAHEIFRSVVLASIGVDSLMCGRFHLVELIVTNS